MKTKIFLFLMGCLLIITSCSEDFITEDMDKSRYTPETFYNNRAHAEQALNAAYSGLNQFGDGYTFNNGCMIFVLGDDLYQTGFAAGFGDWGPVSEFNITNTQGPVNNLWQGIYSMILYCNNALEVMPKAQEIAPPDDGFTQAVLDNYMGQAYFLRAYCYYSLFQYYPRDKVVIREGTPESEEDFTKAPATEQEAFNFIVSDLQEAQQLLTDGLNTTAGYEPGRATRGAAAALLGKLYMNSGMYTEAAAEFRKILPGIGDASYGTYSLVDNYRDNFTIAGENNSESIFEIQFADITGQSGFANNDVHWLVQNFTLNRTTNGTMWWNFAVPVYRLDEYETWTEDIGGTPTTIYDYRAYATFWGLPNGTNYTFEGDVRDWQEQGWTAENVGGTAGAYGIRKWGFDNTDDFPLSGQYSWSDMNLTMIRLADIMLLYAECMAQINPSNTSAADVNSAVYWVDLIRNRANNVAVDQAHLYSARAGMPGQLSSATDLMTSNGWTLMQLVEHERYVEGYCEGWRKEDLRRWQKGASYVRNKSGWTGYEKLILPVPQTELDRNPNM